MHSLCDLCGNVSAAGIREDGNGSVEAVSGIYGNGTDHDLVPGEPVISVGDREEKIYPHPVCLCTVGIVAGLLQSGGCEDHIRTGGWRNLLPDSVASAGDTGCCIHCGQSLWKAEGISEICGDNGRTDPVYAVRKPDLPQSLFSKSRECLSCTPECSGYL